MCFRRIKFRHKPLAEQIIVIPHTKKLMLAIEMYFEVMESFGLILCDIH